MADWLPDSRDGQIAMCSTWIGYLTSERRTAWGIPAAEFTELGVRFDAARTVLQKSKDESQRTQVITAECKAAFEALTDTMRFFKSHYFLSPPLVEADIVALGLKPRKPSSPIPRPKGQPTADLAFPGIHMVELRDIRRAAGSGEDDPRSDYGVRIFYGLSGAPSGQHRFRVSAAPRTGGDLPESIFSRRRRELFDFEGESGETVYFILQYEKPSGGKEGKGPFGPLLTARIP
ncbi:MAG: hypothetical protein LBI67_03835 [Treponema sp.]|jgi:hypothetical protein|nr:hypothetical protein [Treponema sp.]